MATAELLGSQQSKIQKEKESACAKYRRLKNSYNK